VKVGGANRYRLDRVEEHIAGQLNQPAECPYSVETPMTFDREDVEAIASGVAELLRPRVSVGIVSVSPETAW
jgi:hypothetical protein